MISVVPPGGPIFADDFGDGAAPEDWVWGSGTWVAAGGVYTASNVKATNLARIAPFEPTASPVLAGVIRARVKMTATAARSGPNGMLVFGYQSPSQYRWVKITKTQVQIGQTGTLGGVGAGVKKKIAVKPQPANRFLLFTVKVYADGSVKVFKGAATGRLSRTSSRAASLRRSGSGLGQGKDGIRRRHGPRGLEAVIGRGDCA